MGAGRQWFLVAYDVREPRRLRRVAKCLQAYGVRVQYSLFRCRLSERDKERLRWELAELMEPEDDLLLIGLCGACATRVTATRGEEDWHGPPPSYEIV